jgi:flagellar motor switch protein FliN/FliY
MQHPLVFRPRITGWKTNDQIKEGLGAEPIILPIKVGSLEGSAFWIMPKEGIVKFTSWMMNGQAKSRPLSSDILAEGFYRYLALQVLDVLSPMDPLQTLPLLLSESSLLPENDAFCIDVEIDFDKHSSWGRLVLEPKLQKSWAEYFSTPIDPVLTNTGRITEVNVGIKIGSTLLSQREWKKIKKGDFLLLDKGSYDPRKQTGAAYLTLGQTPLFQVKIKQNKMQLIDYAFMYEEEMQNKNPPPPEPSPGEAELLAASEEVALAVKELPIFVTVELARLRITLEKLMQLTPGNLIELPIHPDQAAKLTVNGQLVGHAELVHLGETLGLRILDLG